MYRKVDGISKKEEVEGLQPMMVFLCSNQQPGFLIPHGSYRLTVNHPIERSGRLLNN